MPTLHVPIGQVKARPNEFLSRVRAGEEVVITDRGTPVGRMGARAVEGRRTELARAGLIREPVCTLDPAFHEAERPRDPGARSLEAVHRERSHGW